MAAGEGGEKAKGGVGGEYGTFQGPPSFPPPRPPVAAYPQPVPPPGLFDQRRGYQSGSDQENQGGVRGHSHDSDHDRLPCWGIGIGWLLFIIGFFLAAIPWYVGAIFLFFTEVDEREKPGYVACTIAAVIAIISTILGALGGLRIF